MVKYLWICIIYEFNEKMNTYIICYQSKLHEIGSGMHARPDIAILGDDHQPRYDRLNRMRHTDETHFHRDQILQSACFMYDANLIQWWGAVQSMVIKLLWMYSDCGWCWVEWEWAIVRGELSPLRCMFVGVGVRYDRCAQFGKLLGEMFSGSPTRRSYRISSMEMMRAAPCGGRGGLDKWLAQK